PRVGHGAGHRGCGRGDGVGCGHRHGARLRRRADEHGHRGRAGRGVDGQGDEAGCRGRPAGLQVGAHRQEALRDSVLADRGPARLDQLSLTLVTDRAQTGGRDLVSIIGECLAAGLPAVQVREKDLGAADLAVLCRQLRNLTRDTGALLIVNDRVDVALAVGADAVQRTGTSLDVKDMRDIAGRNLRIGASVHSLEEALDAEWNGADWVVFGPVYDTPSKRAYGPPQGLERL